MSDHPAAAASLAEQLGLGACAGTPFCECAAHAGSPVRSASVGSPSRTRTGDSNSGDSSSGGSSDNSGSHEGATSEALSDTSVLEAVNEYEWDGLTSIRLRQCAHGRLMTLKKCVGGKNSDHLFLGCPIQDELAQCPRKIWVDKPWPARAQETLKDLWRQLKHSKREEARSSEALVEAIEMNETANADRVRLLDEVERTKRVAERVCGAYHKKAAYVVVDKSKLMFVIYILLAIICFLIAAFFVKN